MAEFDEKEISKFLDKVDQVGSLIKGLTSGDPELESQASKDADKFLKNDEQKTSMPVGFERSQINKYDNDKKEEVSSLDYDGGPKFDQESMSPEDFMKHIEKDAAERRKRKEQSTKKANELKEKGNRAFKQNNFEDAIKYYTNGIDIVKDNPLLYTNRAQAYIHLAKYELALNDCLMAQKIDAKCVKAYIHHGRALQNLNRFEEAIQSFENVKKIDKKHTKLIAGYVKDVLKKKEIHKEIQELKIICLEKSGDEQSKVIKNTINRLRKESILLEELVEMLQNMKKIIGRDDVYRTLFRTSGGFKIIAENPTISRLFKKSNHFNQMEQRCIFAMLDLLSQVCIDNDENIMEFLYPSFLQYLQKFISLVDSLKIRVASACLVHNISQLEAGRQFILQDGKNYCIVDGLLGLLTEGHDATLIAAGAINNLALYEGLSEELSNTISVKFTNYVIAMMVILNSTKAAERSPLTDSILSITSKCLSTITNLAKDVKIRTMLAKNCKLWECSSELLITYGASLGDPDNHTIVFSLLGLLMNISLVGTAPDFDCSKKIDDICCRFILNGYPDIEERSAGLLNHLLTTCPDLVSYTLEGKSYSSFIAVLMGENDSAKKHIIKCIALCSSSNSLDLAEKFLQDKASTALLGLLNSNAATVVGNAALTVGNCASNKSFSKNLASTNVIQHLLRIATNDEYGNVIKHNAAIAIGKLAAVDQRHLERLRELHGLEILHEVMKANKMT